VVNQHMLERLY